MGGRGKPVEVALQMELEVSAAATATRITHARQSSSACQQISERRQGARAEKGQRGGAASIAVGDASRG